MKRLLSILVWLGAILLSNCQVPSTTPTPTSVPIAVSPLVPPPTSTSPSSPPPAIQSPVELPPPSQTPTYTYRIIQAYPHDREAFTQGLIFQNGVLYESTGLRGRSSLRRVDLETGEVLQILPLANQYFGEGITLYEDKIYQLTWQSRVGFVYDEESFELLQEFSYPTEGWGITHDGQRLIVSDGTATLYFWDPETLEEIGRVQVRDQGKPVTWLNELEYVQGEIYANVWQTNRIARIEPQTGQVVGWVLLQGLLTPEDLRQPVDVLNGIAYDAANDRLFVTGKLWPKLLEIELVPVE